MSTVRFLMCPPDFFDVRYEINPWMRGKQGAVRNPVARAQWNALYAVLTETLGATVELMTPQPNLPDLVFTANAGLVRGKTVIPSRFRFVERQGEEPYFADWFRATGHTLTPLPDGIAFEGAGDALFDTADPHLLWAAHGYRTELAAHAELARLLDVEVVSLKLIDPRFYHLDTCFCPLPGGRLLWYPPAFDSASIQAVIARVPAPRRHEMFDTDAVHFAANAVVAGNAVVVNACTVLLSSWVRSQGMLPYATPLTQFINAGGSAKCLTLQLG